MKHENFIERVLNALVEMRLDEGIVKRKNKAFKRKLTKTNASDGIDEEDPRDQDRYEVKSGRYNQRLKVRGVKDYNLTQAGIHRRKGNKLMAKHSLSIAKDLKSKKLP